MKTLKKSLCLVLALVMVLGVCAISASADLDYEDVADVKYLEAVDVLSGIGVLEGYEDGTFLPGKDVSREEAAKIIAYLMIGDDYEADALVTTADPFTDVAKDRWSAGYIAYCAQMGIVDGLGDGTFDPTAKVTGLQFAKMLLCALGYGANDEYCGANWAINVAKDALQYGIFDDNTAGANNQPATREECALYAFNTLELAKVNYSALLGGYIEGFLLYGESNKENSFADDFDLKKVDVDEDAFERPGGHQWKQGKKIITDGVYDDDADLVGYFTTPVTGNELYTLIGKAVLNNKDDHGDPTEINFYEDGVKYTGSGSTDIEKGNTKDIAASGYGVETYVYVLGNAEDGYEVRICQINTYLAKVTKVVAESKTKDAETTVKYAGTALSDKTFECDTFKKDDQVLVTYSKKLEGGDEMGIQSMELAELVDDEIISFTTRSGVAYVGTEDVVYTQAALQEAFEGTLCKDLTKACIDKEYTLLLDRFGYLVNVDKIVADTKYVYVAQFGVKANTADSLQDSNVLAADVYYADGTHEIVTVNTSKVSAKDALKPEYAGKTYYSLDVIGDQFDQYEISHEKANIKTLNDDYLGVYTLTTKSGKAVLDRAALVDPEVEYYYNFEDAGYAPAITKGVTKMFNMTLAGSYTDKKTVFFYVEGEYGKDDFKVTAYNGIGNIPVADVDVGEEEAIVIDGFTASNGASPAKYIYTAVSVAASFDSTEDGEDVYFPQVRSGVNKYYINSATKTVEYDVYFNGEKQTVTFEYASLEKAQDGVDSFLALGTAFGTINNKGLWTAEVCDSKDKVQHLCEVIGEADKVSLYIESYDFGDTTGYWYDAEDMVVVNLTKKDANDLGEIVDLVKEGNDVLVAFDYNKNTLAIGTLYVISVA